MRLINLSTLFRSLYSMVRAQQEETDLRIPLKAALVLGYDAENKRFIPPLQDEGQLRAYTFTNPVRVTTNTTTVMSNYANNKAVVWGFIVNGAGTGSTISIQQADGTPYIILPTTTVGLYLFGGVGIGGMHQFVTAGTGAADVTVLSQDNGEPQRTIYNEPVI